MLDKVVNTDFSIFWNARKESKNLLPVMRLLTVNRAFCGLDTHAWAIARSSGCFWTADRHLYSLIANIAGGCKYRRTNLCAAIGCPGAATSCSIQVLTGSLIERCPRSFALYYRAISYASTIPITPDSSVVARARRWSIHWRCNRSFAMQEG